MAKAHTQIVYGDKGLTLAALNMLVSQQEGQHGPLIAVGHTEQQTMLTFDSYSDIPEKNAVIAEAPKTGNPPNTVCVGNAFVEGKIVAVVATR